MSTYVSEEEQKYFTRKELERLKKYKEEQRKLIRAEEEERARRIHQGRCPKCYGELKETMFKKHVKVHRCQGCGGVWLDKGELEILAGKKEKYLSSFFRDYMKRPA